MSKKVILKALSHYDSKEILDSELFQARCGVPGDDYKVTTLGGSRYEIELIAVPENYRKILRQFGTVKERPVLGPGFLDSIDPLLKKL